MGILIGWIIFSIIVGALGSGRKIGFAGAFFLSLLLSPLIGLIITLFSKDKEKDKEDEEYKNEVLNTQKQQEETLSKIQDNAKTTSISDEFNKLKEMKDNGLLTEEEFQKAKEKLLSK